MIFLFRPRARSAGRLVFLRHRRRAADLPPYAKSAATRLYRDLWFSSDTRRKPNPAPGSPADDRGRRGKNAGDFRAARTGCPRRGLGATAESFRAGRGRVRLRPTPVAKPVLEHVERATGVYLLRWSRDPRRPPWSPTRKGIQTIGERNRAAHSPGIAPRKSPSRAAFDCCSKTPIFIDPNKSGRRDSNSRPPGPKPESGGFSRSWTVWSCCSFFVDKPGEIGDIPPLPGLDFR